MQTYGREEQPGVRVGPIGEHLPGEALLDDPALAHHQHVVGDVLDHRQVVPDEDERDPGVPADLVEQPQDLGLDRHVQGGHGLVQDQHPQARGERPGDRETPALAAREPPGPGRGLPFAEADPVEEVRGQVLVPAVQAQRGAQAPVGRQTRVERDVRVLEDHLDLPGAGRVGRLPPGRASGRRGR
ncbi:hypothetical protein GCM10010270_68750 [Streptomyces violaceus]|nr:hypothetical protein GCM10010270_68750 [Streptomyces janthinus]